MSFEGSIGEMDLIHRLVELSREHFTGAIRFEQDGIIKIIYFKGGDVLSASTNDRKDAIDEILFRAGKVSREHIKQALAKRQESETLGDALLNLGFITRKELTWARRIQVIGILRSVKAWPDGTYAIVADYLPKREEGTLFPLPQIVVEFMVTEQDRSEFDRAMDSGEAVFEKSATFGSGFPALDLNEDAADIVRHVDGAKTAAEVAGAAGAEAFNVYKLLEALRILGLLEKKGGVPNMDFAPALDATPPPDDFSFESAGVADASEAFTPQPVVEQPAPLPQFAVEDDEPKIPFALSPSPESTAPASTPVWGNPEPTRSAAVVPATVIEDKKWGFDEAQIEASERAIVPPGQMAVPPKRTTTVSKPAPQSKSRGGLLYAVIIALLVAGIGLGGWMWWQTKNTPPPEPLVVRRPAKRPVITPPPQPATETSGGQPPSAVPVVATKTGSGGPLSSTVAPQPQPAPPSVARLENTTTGGKLITNTPPPAPVSRATSGKYEDMAREYAKNPSGNFTVQFELVCQASSLQKAIAGGGSNVWFVAVTYRGQPCYRVFWGHYDTRDAAMAALGKIPEALKGSTPVVVSVPKS